MWIMLTKKLPTEVSPPKMSLFWSVPWPMTGGDFGPIAKKQRERYENELLGLEQDGFYGMYSRRKTNAEKERLAVLLEENPIEKVDLFYDELGRGMEHNYSAARKIRFAGHDIRVFPHEYSAITRENMAHYVLGVNGEAPSHELQLDEVADQVLVRGILDGETRPIYDAALVDGATHAQAMASAMGVDVTIPDAEFLPIGWYRIRREYGEHFCHDWELEEKRKS